MKHIGLMKALCLLCIVGGLGCKLFIKDNTLGSILGIFLMAMAIVILAIAMHKSKKQ
jgi:hypothetical protein